MADWSDTSEEPRAEETPEAPADEAPAEGAPKEPAERDRAMPLHALETRDVLIWCLGLLAAKAWEGMGLVPNPASGQVGKNLEGAQLAIDAYAAVFGLVREGVEPAPRREMETLLMNLRINFVEKRGS